MPLTDLLASLDAQAAAELEEVTAVQRAQAADLRATARRDAEQLRDHAVEEARTQAETDAATMLNTVTAGIRHRRDEALHRELDRLLEAVRERVRAAPGTPEGDAATVALLREALTVLPDATSIRVHPDHVVAAGQVVADHPGAPGISADLDQLGAVVADGHGRRVVNTADERLAAVWPAIRVRVAASWRRLG